MTDITLSLDALRDLAVAVFLAHDTSNANARQVADALVLAEADGQTGHGASRIPSYAAQSRSGKVDGHAMPTLEQVGPAALRIDARGGFAYPALALAIEALADLAPRTGIAAAAIARSHHAGVAGHPVETLAAQGLIGISMSNTPEAIAPWGGTRALFGTNPLAFAAPRPAARHAPTPHAAAPPLVIDMSLSKVARGRIAVAAQKGEAIPEGWAVDADGKPTTDARAALAGALLPMGDAKGAQLVLMVEILSAALTASQFGFEASSFFTGDGAPPHVGQFLIAIDPGPFSAGGFGDRLETLLAAIAAQPGTRLPGARRFELRAAAERDGVRIPAALHKELEEMRRGPS